MTSTLNTVASIFDKLLLPACVVFLLILGCMRIYDIFFDYFLLTRAMRKVEEFARELNSTTIGARSQKAAQTFWRLQSERDEIDELRKKYQYVPAKTYRWTFDYKRADERYRKCLHRQMRLIKKIKRQTQKNGSMLAKESL